MPCLRAGRSSARPAAAPRGCVAEQRGAKRGAGAGKEKEEKEEKGDGAAAALHRLRGSCCRAAFCPGRSESNASCFVMPARAVGGGWRWDGGGGWTFHRYPVPFCCRVTDGSGGEV